MFKNSLTAVFGKCCFVPTDNKTAMYNRFLFVSYFTQNTSVHHYRTREKHSLHLYNPHTDFGKRLGKFKGSRLWNNLPDSVKILNSIPAFKIVFKIIY